MECMYCGSERLMPLGILGDYSHFRCRECGMIVSLEDCELLDSDDMEFAKNHFELIEVNGKKED